MIRISRCSLSCHLGGAGTYRECQSESSLRVRSPPEISLSLWGFFLRKLSVFTLLKVVGSLDVVLRLCLVHWHL